MGLFDGLGKFGLDNLDSNELFEDEKKKPSGKDFAVWFSADFVCNISLQGIC